MACKCERGVLALFALAAAAQSAIPAFASPDGVAAKTIFRKRCMACHTFGKGIKVGPDLKGVTDRRERDWVLKFIRSSSTVIQSGDLIATKLFAEFKQERMPDWSDLSFGEIGAIVDYLASNGPEQKEPDERHANTASAAEIEAGRQLFHGEKALTYGGAACHTCHSLSRTGSQEDGTLGPNLSHTYFRFQDKSLTDFLKRPCVLREPEVSTGRYLTPQESFEVKAYLARVATSAVPRAAAAPPLFEGRAGGNEPHPVTLGNLFSRAWLHFEVWPYAMLAAFAAGAGARWAVQRNRAGGSACRLTDARAFWRMSRCWIFSLLVLTLGHFAGLLFPHYILLWNAKPARLYLLESVAFAAGLGALEEWARMMWRHLSRVSGSAASQIADTIFLALIFAVLVSGLAASVLYRWSSSWGVLTVTPYAQSVLRGRPAGALVGEMPFLVRLHLLCAITLVPLIPFTSAAPLLIHGVRRGFELILVPIRDAVQPARTALAAWIARRGPAIRIWPEED